MVAHRTATLRWGSTDWPFREDIAVRDVAMGRRQTRLRRLSVAVSNPNALQCMRRSGSFAQRAVAVAPAPSQDVVVAPEEPQEGEEEPAPKPRGSRTLSVWDRYDN